MRNLGLMFLNNMYSLFSLQCTEVFFLAFNVKKITIHMNMKWKTEPN